MPKKYVFINQDLSGFGDYDYTIVDTEKGIYLGIICQTDSLKRASLIVEALNAYVNEPSKAK